MQVLFQENKVKLSANGRNNSQQCWELLRRFAHGASQRLTGFKLCETPPNVTQQHATGCANGRNM